MLSPLLLAFSFLTRFPVDGREEYDEDDYGNSYMFFPVVGLAVGALLALAAAGFSYIGTREGTTAFLLLVILVAATGGLHLDGVADTADGFFGGRDRNDALRIMKESSTGTFGVAAVVLILIGKFAALWSILSIGAPSSIIPALVLSRWAMSAASYKSAYPRDAGTGKSFTGRLTLQSYLISTAVAVGIAFLFAGKAALIPIAVAAVIALVVKTVSYRKIGGVTGDVLGTVNEITELVLLTLH
ncbi:MAG: adenosylcobinamide-GDP ribazoletransferase [Nitrospinota bacterium]